MTHIKQFNEFLNERNASQLNEGSSTPLITIDLQEEMPKEMGRESRTNTDEDDYEDYTDDITTTLDVFDASEDVPKDDDYSYAHPTFKTEPVKIRLEYIDKEGGYGTYGPHGGGHGSTIYAGVKNLEKSTILDFFKKIWKEEDYWAV